MQSVDQAKCCKENIVEDDNLMKLFDDGNRDKKSNERTK